MKIGIDREEMLGRCVFHHRKFAEGGRMARKSVHSLNGCCHCWIGARLFLSGGNCERNYGFALSSSVGVCAVWASPDGPCDSSALKPDYG